MEATQHTMTMDMVERSKSPSDKKEYRLLTLPNALQVLLISTINVPRPQGDGGESEDEDEDEFDESDEEDDDEAMSDEEGSEHSAFEDGGHALQHRRAGACLTVGVGSFAEPENLPGLAHYLEHMVFMGSEKYPDENEFEAFLSSHGGFSNGATDNEVTSYTFEVGPAHLEQALDMFAQFFIAPLMKADALERELSAIESEFSQATQSDQTRMQQVLCDTAPSSHPYHRFGWGNRKSLKENAERDGIPVRDEILAFYNRYYSANLMKLVVCGEDSLDDLEKWVRTSYSAIPNKQVTRPTFENAGAPFGAGIDASPLLCRVVPVRDIHTLHLNWAIPTVFGQHRQKPADYVASLLGHESEGSILSLLKARGWISSLTAGVTDSDGFDCGTYGAKFDITIKLTLEGISQWEEIIAAVFEYLVMLRASGYPEWVFEELQALADISFRFQEDTSAVEHCEELASIMQDMFHVEPQDLLRYDLFSGPFDRDGVVNVVKYLTPENLRVVLISQTNAAHDTFKANVIEEEWFGVKYTKEVITSATIGRWSNATANTALHLPKQNPFIPKDFALVGNASEVTGTVDPQSPQEFAFGRSWFTADGTFLMPRAYLSYLIQLPSVTQNVEHLVLTELFVKLVRDALNEYAYHASVAELMYSLRVKESGLELLFGGFNDKLATLVQVVTDKLFTGAIKLERFEPIRQDMLREYRNSLIKPAHKARYLRLQLLERHAFPVDTAIAALESASTDRLMAFVSGTLWTSGAFLATFAHGNVSSTTADEMKQIVEHGLELVSTPLQPQNWPARHIHKLPVVESGLRIEAKSERAEEKNSQVEYYFQFGEHDVRLLAYADLLHQLMEEPLFDTLRTKQELGYDVSCTVRLTHGVIGYGIMVQSSLFTVDYIDSCIERFLVDFERAIASMPEEHFQDHIKAQILKKLEPDHTLLETSHRYWYEITSGRLIFDINERLASEFELCTKAELLAYYRAGILQAPRKLVVHVIGQASVNVTGATREQLKQESKEAKRNKKRKGGKEAAPRVPPTVISDLYDFKTKLAYYPDRFQLGGKATEADSEDRTAL
ncbi:hypothetical protein Poli38472_003355 [Pythium oligandrum]|uniref:Nardilysin n=1 Tax=Pythium oligandrum TaxID=41045 RepID=A0A8K1C6N6_PYTOL|nr:hypothetical protein Poli38472_003355 [Pythium oligandrum]|eukprot:TMW57430.1 hypothetical protein Poli38472_003355 [Pythium oligandrum]